MANITKTTPHKIKPKMKPLLARFRDRTYGRRRPYGAGIYGRGWYGK